MTMRQVVHATASCHASVTNLSVFSATCVRLENYLHDFNGLRDRLKFGRSKEQPLIQGKIDVPGNFPTELSTETVDAFSLEPVALTLQPETGIKAPR
ncbi:hypothetical protein SDC9_12971 [bioreactor metagenome]|uniref:Uncharacterized protein n=1 Tax=bioreactor metagenome TaxID=1076179 RepID=A0A644TK44_9ZZZZ